MYIFYLYFPSLSYYISMCQNTALTIACIPTPPSPAAPKLVMDMTRPNIMPMPPSSILSRVKAFLPEMQLANTTLQQEMYTLLFFIINSKSWKIERTLIMPPLRDGKGSGTKYPCPLETAASSPIYADVRCAHVRMTHNNDAMHS